MFVEVSCILLRFTTCRNFFCIASPMQYLVSVSVHNTLPQRLMGHSHVDARLDLDQNSGSFRVKFPGIHRCRNLWRRLPKWSSSGYRRGGEVRCYVLRPVFSVVWLQQRCCVYFIFSSRNPVSPGTVGLKIFVARVPRDRALF